MDSEPDFFQNRDCGQLWLDDRRLIWKTLRELGPKLAVETGTWLGGGSTFFIASALKANGYGMLHTVETDVGFYAEAMRRYLFEWPHLKPYVQFHVGDSTLVYKNIFKDEVFDFIFLDGSQDEQKTKEEFELLTPRLRAGGILMAHDWFNGKADAIKPFIVGNPNWYVTTIGTGTGTFEAGSVGMAKALKLK